MNAAERRDLSVFIVSAFTVSELRRLLSYDAKLSVLVPEVGWTGSLIDVTDAVITGVERHNVLAALAPAMVGERPHRAAEIRALFAHAPTPAPPPTRDRAAPAWDPTRPEARALVRALADTVFRDADILAVVKATGLSPGTVRWDSALDAWRSVFEQATNRARLDTLLAYLNSDDDLAVLRDRLAPFVG